MSEPKVAQLLNLEQTDELTFRGDSWDFGYRAVYGGQVLGQALSAAYRTVSNKHSVHSLHSYFLLPGNVSVPLIYEVELVRNGKSFSTRRVRAMQNGNTIFYLTASFQVPEQGLFNQADVMPQVTQPEQLESDLELFKRNFKNIAQAMEQSLAYHTPIETRTVDAVNAFSIEKREPKRHLWMRSVEGLASDTALHNCVLAYASDNHFLTTSLQPHGIPITQRNLRIATIDHSIWFHRPFDFNEWLLYSNESPISIGSRGLVRGSVFNRDGQLVATTMQEGLMRLTEQ